MTLNFILSLIFLFLMFVLLLSYVFFYNLLELKLLLSNIILRFYKQCSCDPQMYRILHLILNKIEKELQYELSLIKNVWYRKTVVDATIVKSFEKKFINFFNYYNKVYHCLTIDQIALINTRLKKLYLLFKKIH